MSETAILSNQHEAIRLYQRGVAAARGGQRRIAAGLLQRAVQLDPQHEGAWLWLSGVLDDPTEAAYCLQTVLELNPANQHARAGLDWIAQRQKAAQQSATTSGRLPIVQPQADSESAQTREARYQGESWWVNWRRSRQAMNRARIVMWLMPITLLILTLAWRYSVEMTVARIQSNLRPSVVPTMVALSVAPGATPEALPPSRPIASDDAAILAYLSRIEPLREQLRQAVEDYRQAIRQPGGSSIQHSASARQLRDKVQNAHDTMRVMTPPRSLKDLHAAYIAGLAKELEALDDMVAFYGEYRVALANRAALRFQESNTHFARAQTGFDSHRTRIERMTVGPSVYMLR